jgi:hypothetical protein
MAVCKVASRRGVKRLLRWQLNQPKGQSLDLGLPTGGQRNITVADELAVPAQAAAMPDSRLAEQGAARVVEFTRICPAATLAAPCVGRACRSAAQK